MNMANATELNPSIAQENFLGSPAQQKAARQLDAAKKLDRSPAAMGTAAQPYFTTSQENNTSRLGPGVYYWDWDGALHQTPGAPISTGEGISAGVKRGYIKDPETSFGNMMAVPVKAFSDTFNDIVIRRNPFLSEEDRRAELSAPNEIDKALAGYKADRNAYDARYGNNGWATGGRLAGNVAFTAPLMGGAGAALEAAPGMSFVAGTAGKGGNLLLRGSSLATRGALEGAGSSAILSSQTDKPLSEQLKEGVLIGAAIPLVGNALYGGGKAAVGGIRNALIDPITEAGQNKIVNRFLQERAAGAPVAIDSVSPIPGVQRTTAQSVVGGNSGLSALERSTKATNTEFSNQFDSLMKSNNEARKAYVSDLAGTKDDLAALTQQRDAAATPLREAAFQNVNAADPQPVIAEIDKILQSPAGQSDAVQEALSAIKKKLAKTDADGKISLQTDPEQLYGIRKAIDTSLSPLAIGTTADKRLASGELMQVKSALDDAIEESAPGFGSYLAKYAELSKPVNEAQYLQSLNLVDSNGHMTLGKVDSALKAIEKLRSKSGVNPAKSISDDAMEKLRSLRDDLQAEGQSNAGRGAGSDTAQKLATAGMTKALGASKLASIPLALASGLGTMALGHNPMESTLVGGGSKMVLDAANSFYGAKNAEIHNKLISVLLDPEYANFAVNPVVNRRLIPAGANKLLSTVRSQGTMVGGVTLNNRLRSAE
ncbi:hypothetical protein ABENE_23270 [Asticcacaulis benevestitus DSM 16100 = ATCC BAA-896]|uniref:Uncharacterized protein n=3 Tax=Asticcacaulis TaxID=76890 RepID=V4NXQ5_9CAUL|nr:hypothetical protein ABENE_23270 [Asticcacaulis benevestitus DSM 16100 = ATCC BAA-896]